MKRNKKNWTILYVVSIIVVIIFFINQPSTKEVCKQLYEKEKVVSYSGIVLSKYRDSTNHYDRVIELKTKEKIIVEWDKSGLYEFVQFNDRIIKKEGSYEVKLYRNSTEHSFVVDFKCNTD